MSGCAAEVRLRGRGKDRALRGVGSERPKGGNNVIDMAGDELVKDDTREAAGEGSSPEKAIVIEEEEKRLEGSPSKRRRVGEGGESVPTGVRGGVPVRRKPTRVPGVSRASGHTSKVVPAKRPIEAVVPKRPATKPSVPKSGRPVVKRAPAKTRPAAASTAGPSRPAATATARSAGSAHSTLPKPPRPKPLVPRLPDVTKP